MVVVRHRIKTFVRSGWRVAPEVGRFYDRQVAASGIAGWVRRNRKRKVQVSDLYSIISDCWRLRSATTSATSDTTMRSIQVVDESSGNVTRSGHVVGVDESGNVTGSAPFALAAVRCPREDGERLAELLLEHGLSPWQGKSKTVARSTSPDERNQRVENLIDSLDDEPVTWRVAAGYSSATIDHKAAGVCTLAKKTITSGSDFRGDSVIVPDGEPDMYGTRQEYLRVQAAQTFDGSFQSVFGEVYVTGLARADLTYPEVAAADYLAGYVRAAIADGRSVDALPDEVIWFSQDWREPSVSPFPFYRIHGVTGEYGATERTRVAAWIKGRHPDGGSHDVSSQWENTVRMLESDRLQQYLLESMSR